MNNRATAARSYMNRQIRLLIAGTATAGGVPRPVVRLWLDEELRDMAGDNSGPSSPPSSNQSKAPDSRLLSPESEASSP